MVNQNNISLNPCVHVRVVLSSCVSLCVAVQKMAEAHMQHLGVHPPLEDEEEDDWQREYGEVTHLPLKLLHHQGMLWWQPFLNQIDLSNPSLVFHS